MTDEIVVKLNKASPIPGSPPVLNLRVEASETVPHGAETEGMSLNHMRAMYAGQALAVTEAMFATLPGGLIDAILVELMRRTVSVLAVPYETVDDDGNLVEDDANLVVLYGGY